MNIFVVLLGNVQLSFLMGTTARQGKKLPLPPRLLRRDTGSHPKVEETTTVAPVSGNGWADCASLCFQRGSRCRCCPFPQATGIFPPGTSLPYDQRSDQRQFRLRDDFRIGQLPICGADLPAAPRAACPFLGQGMQRRRSPCSCPCHAYGGRGQTEGPCAAGQAPQRPPGPPQHLPGPPSTGLPAPFPAGGCVAPPIGLTRSH